MADTEENKPENKEELPPFAPLVANSVYVFLSVAFQYLGLQPTEKGELAESTNVDLEQAKLAIDLSDLLLQKIKDRLATDERRPLEDMLANARLRYVRALK